MTRLRITNIYSVQIYGYLIAGSAAHADISLCEITVLSINVTMRALFPSTDGTLLPVTDTESNFNVFPNESVVFKSADLAARQELDKTVRTTATRQPHVRFIKFKRIFKSHTPAKVRNNLDNPKLWGVRSC